MCLRADASLLLSLRLTTLPTSGSKNMRRAPWFEFAAAKSNQGVSRGIIDGERMARLARRLGRLQRSLMAGLCEEEKDKANPAAAVACRRWERDNRVPLSLSFARAELFLQKLSHINLAPDRRAMVTSGCRFDPIEWVKTVLF